MKKSSIFILLACVTLFSGLVAYASSPSPERRKARYYYLEGAKMQAMGKLPEAYEYYKKAWLTDPTYEEASFFYGMNRLGVATDSMQSEPELKKSLAMLRSYVDAYPADLFEARPYAYIAGRVDTIGEAIRVYERLDSLRPSLTTNLLQLADAYMMAHQEEKALSALDRFETSEGKSPQLSLKKMSVMLAKGDTVAAEAEVNSLIATNPRDPNYYLLKGNLYEVMENNDSVLAAYLRAEELNPDYGPAKLSLATYYKNVGDSVAYDRKVYEALLSEDFQLEDKLGLLSEYLQTLLDDKSDTARGDHLFEVLMEQYPHETSVLDLAARYSGAKEDYDEAIRLIGYAIDLDSNNPQFWEQLMTYQISADKGEDAMATFDRANGHIAATDQMRLLYASGATMAKKYDEAEKMFANLIQYYSEDLPVDRTITDNSVLKNLSYETLNRISSYYSMLGDMYYGAKQLEKAYSAYDNSLLFNPDNSLSLNNYAYFMTENDGDLDRAEEMARRAIELAPDNETFLDTMAWVLFKKKEYKEALEFQEKAIEQAEQAGEEAAEFYNHMGDILFMNHEPEKAVENWKKALKLDPDNALLKKKVTHKTFFYE